MTKTLFCLYETTGYDGQNLMGIYSTKDKAIRAFEIFASNTLKYNVSWLDKDGYFCHSQRKHKRILIYGKLFYMQEKTLDLPAHYD